MVWGLQPILQLMTPRSTRTAPPGLTRDRNRVYVVAGEICVCSAPLRIYTVLGSCVSVCLWSKLERIGGLNHYLLPLSAQGDKSYLGGNLAIPALIEEMARAGCMPNRLVAKVFGGAHVRGQAWNTGSENVLVAWSELRKAQIPIVAADVGETCGRRLSFDVATGQVEVRRLRRVGSERTRR